MRQFIVFDIETAPIKWDTLSDSQQEYLLRGTKTDEDVQKKKFEMGLSPMTAHVVTIGLQLMVLDENGEWKIENKAAFSSTHNFDNNESTRVIDKLETGYMNFITSEKRLLQDFWRILQKYESAKLISFNGRNFDAPFLMLRSALLGVKPTRNLMDGTKFNYHGHIDLLDELTFFNGSPYGATRRFNFDFYTRQFGIVSPKSKGVDGSMVGELYYKGEINIIAEYCLRDIQATWELFLKWDEFLNFS